MNEDYVALKDRYFSKITGERSNMVQAILVARMRSKDPRTRVGALVYHAKTGASFVGYNGFIPGFPEAKAIWDNRGDKPGLTKYDAVVHGETNAIRKAHLCLGHLKGCVLYSSHYPCPDCLKNSIAMSGIKTVYYDSAEHFNERTVHFAKYAKVKLVHFPMPKIQLLIDGVEI